MAVNGSEDGRGEFRRRLVKMNYISELTTLRDMYKKDWPENYITYYSLDNCIRLSTAAESSTSSDGNDNASASEHQQQQQHQQRYFTVYCVDGDFSDGTFILFVCDFMFLLLYALLLSFSLNLVTLC